MLKLSNAPQLVLPCGLQLLSELGIHTLKARFKHYVLLKWKSIQFTATPTCVQWLCRQNSALCVCLSQGQRDSSWSNGFPLADWQQKFTGLTVFISAQQKKNWNVFMSDCINFHYVPQRVGSVTGTPVSRSQWRRGVGSIITETGKTFETIFKQLSVEMTLH